MKTDLNNAEELCKLMDRRNQEVHEAQAAVRFDPVEFRTYVARTIFVQAYADWAEQYGHLYGAEVACMGADWMNVAPDTPDAALEAADRLIQKLEKEIAPLEEIANRARFTWLAARPDSKFTDELAYSLTMSSLGHGVGWTEYNGEFEGCYGVNHFEFTFYDLPDSLTPVPEESNAND